MRYLLLAFIVIVSGCNNNNLVEKNIIEMFLNVKISDSVTITDKESFGGIQGKSGNSFIIHFTPKEFSNIFQKVQPDKILYTDRVFGITFNNGQEMTSAIFDCHDQTIKYTHAY